MNISKNGQIISIVFVLLSIVFLCFCSLPINAEQTSEIQNFSVEEVIKDEESEPQINLPMPDTTELEVELNVPLEPIELKPETTIYSETIQIELTIEQKEEIEAQVQKLSEETDMMAQVASREAGGILDQKHQAAVMWCILNRVDNYNSSIKEVITSPAQFAYSPNTAIRPDLKELAVDVVTRWTLEKEGYEDVGRVLPQDYLYFTGDGKYNYFRNAFKANNYWDWSLESPYN